jgi:hypothetical protein
MERRIDLDGFQRSRLMSMVVEDHRWGWVKTTERHDGGK